jgi:hypothetical protein
VWLDAGLSHSPAARQMIQNNNNNVSVLSRGRARAESAAAAGALRAARGTQPTSSGFPRALLAIISAGGISGFEPACRYSLVRYTHITLTFANQPVKLDILILLWTLTHHTQCQFNARSPRTICSECVFMFTSVVAAHLNTLVPRVLDGECLFPVFAACRH